MTKTNKVKTAEKVQEKTNITTKQSNPLVFWIFVISGLTFMACYILFRKY